MNNIGFICGSCKKKFRVPAFYEETHRLDSPPYERIEVCPYCRSGNFFEFNFYTEKTEVANCILPVITKLNGYRNSIKDIFGNMAENKAINDSIAYLAEFVSELFDYTPAEIDRRILNVDTDKECESILMYFRGEL